MKRIASPLLALLPILAGAVGYSATAQTGSLVALAKMERGEWQLRAPDGSSRAICVTDPSVLLQLHHRGKTCSRFVVENSANVARVTYSCAGIGNGDTRIVLETPRLIRLETQGVSQGLPFTEEYEGRRTGPCTATAR